MPEAHLKDHSATPAFEDIAADDRNAAVRYRDHWFFIDDGDWQTKRPLTAVMFFFTLADTDDHAKLPLVTIPAQ